MSHEDVSEVKKVSILIEAKITAHGVATYCCHTCNYVVQLSIPLLEICLPSDEVVFR